MQRSLMAMNSGDNELVRARGRDSVIGIVSRMRPGRVPMTWISSDRFESAATAPTLSAVDEALAEAADDDLLLAVRVGDLLVDEEAESSDSMVHDADSDDVFHDSLAGAAGLALWGDEPHSGV